MTAGRGSSCQNQSEDRRGVSPEGRGHAAGNHHPSEYMGRASRVQDHPFPLRQQMRHFSLCSLFRVSIIKCCMDSGKWKMSVSLTWVLNWVLAFVSVANIFSTKSSLNSEPISESTWK